MKVFLSHDSEDRAVAEELCRDLEAAAATQVWMAPRDVVPGGDYAEQILAAIDAAAVVLVLVSNAANHSSFVKKEIERAVSRGKRIIPVRIEEVAPSGALELYLAGAHWLDAWSLDAGERARAVRRALDLEAPERAMAGGSRRRVRRRILAALGLVLVVGAGLYLAWRLRPAGGVAVPAGTQPAGAEAAEAVAAGPEAVAEAFLRAFDERRIEQAIEDHVPLRLRQTAAPGQIASGLGGLRAAMPGERAERTPLGVQPVTYLPNGSVPGSFELRLFRTRSGPLTFCEQVWLEPGEGRTWKVAYYVALNAPEGDCEGSGSLQSARAAALRFLGESDSGDAGAVISRWLSPDVTDPAGREPIVGMLATMRNLSGSRPPERAFAFATASAGAPFLARQGRFVWVRFRAKGERGAYLQDVWLERAPGGDADEWRVASFAAWPTG